MTFPSPSGPNSYIWNLKQVYNARLGDNWPTVLSGDIALFGGQFESPNSLTIEFVQITTLGNSKDFGDLSTNDMTIGAASNVRGLFCGSNSPTGVQYNNTIDFVNIVNPGNSKDFGDATAGHNQGAGGNSSTRGIFCAGVTGTDPAATISNTIDFVTMATTGNATDFGDTTQTLWRSPASACSGTRMCIAGGATDSSNTATNVIAFITTATTGDATDFGDLTIVRRGAGGNNASSGTRGVFGGGFPTTNVIDYITIASAGDAIDFGDLTVARNGASATSNATRALWAGGGPGPNVIDFVTIATTGNATDFGDLLIGGGYTKGTTSNANGGLQ